METEKFDWQIALMFALLALDFAIVVTGVYGATVPDKLSPIVALIVGSALGIVALAFCFLEGKTVTEITVSAFILLVLLIILMPVFFRMRDNTNRQKLKQQRQQILRKQKTPATK